jgi:hypothetical protein
LKDILDIYFWFFYFLLTNWFWQLSLKNFEIFLSVLDFLNFFVTFEIFNKFKEKLLSMRSDMNGITGSNVGFNKIPVFPVNKESFQEHFMFSISPPPSLVFPSIHWINELRHFSRLRFHQNSVLLFELFSELWFNDHLPIVVVCTEVITQRVNEIVKLLVNIVKCALPWSVHFSESERVDWSTSDDGGLVFHVFHRVGLVGIALNHLFII